MEAMRELSDEFKLSVRSIGEVIQALQRMEADLLLDYSVRFIQKGIAKRPTQAAMVAAIILQIASRPPEERKRMIGEGMTILNTLLAGGDEGEGQGQASDGTATEAGHPLSREVDRRTGIPASPPKQRRKQSN